MAEDIILPKLGFSMTEGNLTEWLFKDGDTVKEGEPLFLLESEKSVQEIEAPISGVLRIDKEAEETYPVGTVLGRIE